MFFSLVFVLFCFLAFCFCFDVYKKETSHLAPASDTHFNGGIFLLLGTVHFLRGRGG